MEPSAYAEMYEQEEGHWWFRGRRAVLWALLRQTPPSGRPRILDAGCGTGRNLVEFGGLGPATGVDPSLEAVTFCRERGLHDVQQAGLETLPFDAGQFDLLLMCDVLEHVPNDATALRELRRVAAAGATLLVTVPAYQWLWTDHDVHFHHFRRYTLGSLRQRALEAGWLPVRATYFNSIMLPLIAPAKLSTRWIPSRSGHSDLSRTPQLLNRALEAPMRLEAAMIGRGIQLPAGVSVGMVCRHPG